MVQVFGRVDDVINRGGEKVVPLEIEEALCRHESVVEAAVVGLPDDEYGSIVAAAVVTTASIDSTISMGSPMPRWPTTNARSTSCGSTNCLAIRTARWSRVRSATMIVRILAGEARR